MKSKKDKNLRKRHKSIYSVSYCIIQEDVYLVGSCEFDIFGTVFECTRKKQ